MKVQLAILISAICLPSWTPFVNEEALNDMGQTMQQADAYERDGYSPGDAWSTARIGPNGSPFGTFGAPGSTPIAGWTLGR
jgi:hypothetical protein